MLANIVYDLSDRLMTICRTGGQPAALHPLQVVQIVADIGEVISAATILFHQHPDHADLIDYPLIDLRDFQLCRTVLYDLRCSAGNDNRDDAEPREDLCDPVTIFCADYPLNSPYYR